jgi:acetyl esterase
MPHTQGPAQYTARARTTAPATAAQMDLPARIAQRQAEPTDPFAAPAQTWPGLRVKDFRIPRVHALDEPAGEAVRGSTPGQADHVPVRFYTPAAAKGPIPAVILVHGGGFVLGDIGFLHGQAAQIALGLGAAVAAVGYRLAPEHPWPAGVNDCFSTLTWLAGEAGPLGVNADRIAVSGTSSGGTLAAGLALLTRDRGGPALCFQHLVTPALDDRQTNPSIRRFTETPVWSGPLAAQSWKYYLAGQEPSPYAAPARAEDLSGLPPTYIATAEFDPLRDEGLQYGLRLLADDVPVELHNHPGTLHGLGPIPGSVDPGVTERAVTGSFDALRRGLALQF